MANQWSEHYKVPDPNCWSGRNDANPDEYFFQALKCIDLRTHTLAVAQATPTYAFLGFCSDAGVERNQGRIGASQGPLMIRKALARIALPQFAAHYYDVGDIVCDNHDLETAQQSLATVVAMLLAKKIKPIVLGGGHELAWGHYQGIQQALKNSSLGIINFDAHFDLRAPKQDKGSSGTSFFQIAEARKNTQQKFDYNCIGIQTLANSRSLFDTAKKFSVNYLLADALHQNAIKQCRDFIDAVLQRNNSIYLSLCLDVFASAFAPGVSAPQSFGLYPSHVLTWLRYIASTKKVISFDVAELCPPYDVDQRTAKLAASFIAEFIQGENIHA